MKLKEVNKSDEIINLILKTTDLLSTTCALRIVSSKLFEKIKLTEFQKVNINVEAFNSARKLMYTTMLTLDRDMLKKLVEPILEKMKIYGEGDKQNLVSAVFKLLEDSKSNIHKEIKRIVEYFALDVESDIEELYVYARDMTLVYYMSIVTLAIILGIDEVLVLHLCDVYLDEYLNKNKIEI